MTKQDVLNTIGNSLKPPVFVNNSLGLMTEKERSFLLKVGAIVSKRDTATQEYSDFISNIATYSEFYDLKRDIEKGWRYAKHSGLNELAANSF